MTLFLETKRSEKQRLDLSAAGPRQRAHSPLFSVGLASELKIDFISFR